MPIKLYKLNMSPPARTAMMACEAFNVPVEMHDIVIWVGEHLKPEYLKKNPLHTIPLLEDGDFILHDSHAILMYLADAYGKTDALYPKDVKRRALVNQKLFFDASILFPRLRSISVSVNVENAKTITEKQISDVEEAYGYIEEFLSRSKFIADDEMTIADIPVFASLSTSNHILPLDPKKYPKTLAWMKHMETQPFCKKYNEAGAMEFVNFFRQRLSG